MGPAAAATPLACRPMSGTRGPSSSLRRRVGVLRQFGRSGLLHDVVPDGLDVILVLALMALLGLDDTPGLLLGGLLGLVALALIGQRLYRRASQAPLTANFPVQRILVLVLAGAAYAQRRPSDRLEVWLAVAIAVLAVLLEPNLRAQLGKVRPVGTGLPGLTEVPPPPFAPGLLAWVSLAEALLGGLGAALIAPGWAYLVLVLVGTLALVVQLLHAIRVTLLTRRWRRELEPALTAYKPVFAFSYNGVKGAGYQLGMWLPYLDRLQRRYVVITRSAATVPAIRKLTTAPILVPREGGYASLDQMLIPSLRTIFYCQGPENNLTVLRFRHLTHLFLNHGDSDKAASYNARHAHYDKVFVAGEQAIARYAAHGRLINHEQFAIVGRPQVERVQVRESPPPAGAPRTVLYAPTWHGGRPSMDYSSLPWAPEIIGALLERSVVVLFRPHPLSYARPNEAREVRQLQRLLEADRETSGRAHQWGPEVETTRDIYDCFNASDALITDVSSVASDYLASGKPLAVVAVRKSGDAFRRDAPISQAAYVIEKDLSTLDAALDGLLGEDPLEAERLAYRRYCLSDNVGPHAAEEFLRVAGDLIDAGRKPKVR